MTSTPLLFRETDCDTLKVAIAESPNNWYAIIDACDSPSVLDRVDELVQLQESGSNKETFVQSMYSGASAKEYRAIAPYLFRLSARLLEWIVSELSDQPWGFLFRTDLDFKGARKHFRNFITVLDPEGEKMLFRFYDPRVLMMFMESANEHGNSSFFGSCPEIVIPYGDSFLIARRSSVSKEIAESK